MKKIVITSLVMVALVVVLVLAAHAFDFMGALRRMHGH
jgi:hypothetical protein